MSVWDSDYNAKKYGTGTPGNPSQWRQAYEQRMSGEEALDVLQGSGDGLAVSRALLGIDAQVYLTVDTIKSAYRRKAMETHPDQGGDEEAYKKVHAAYSLLMDSVEA